MNLDSEQNVDLYGGEQDYDYPSFGQVLLVINDPGILEVFFLREMNLSLWIFFQIEITVFPIKAEMLFS